MAYVGVLGATGTAGSATMSELRARGHDVAGLRRPDVDVVTGQGLDTAFAGLDAVVDCLNAPPKGARAVLVDGVRRALAAAADAGVAHAVSLSIVGCDRVPLGYYRVKVEQEAAVRAAPLATSVVRATQFHGLVDYTFRATRRAGVLPAPRGVLQPVDIRDVAAAVADTVERGPGANVTLAGPEILDIRELARSWRAARGSRRPVLPLPAAGAVLRAIAAGGLTDPGAPRGTRTWADYLANRPAGSAE
jgi:uncharacterized protein YbjT (DUF2867 family)